MMLSGQANDEPKVVWTLSSSSRPSKSRTRTRAIPTIVGRSVVVNTYQEEVDDDALSTFNEVSLEMGGLELEGGKDKNLELDFGDKPLDREDALREMQAEEKNRLAREKMVRDLEESFENLPDPLCMEDTCVSRRCRAEAFLYVYIVFITSLVASAILMVFSHDSVYKRVLEFIVVFCLCFLGATTVIAFVHWMIVLKRCFCACTPHCVPWCTGECLLSCRKMCACVCGGRKRGKVVEEARPVSIASPVTGVVSLSFEEPPSHSKTLPQAQA